MLRSIAHLSDAWTDMYSSDDDWRTCGTDGNSYHVSADEGGKRIDYIMYRTGPNVKGKVAHCELPLPNRVPGKAYSFSDHEAVTATIRVRHDDKASRAQIPDLKRKLDLLHRPEVVKVVREAMDIIHRSQIYVAKDKTRYGLLAGETTDMHIRGVNMCELSLFLVSFTRKLSLLSHICWSKSSVERLPFTYVNDE
jgi:hypothetical protein